MTTLLVDGKNDEPLSGCSCNKLASTDLRSACENQWRYLRWQFKQVGLVTSEHLLGSHLTVWLTVALNHGQRSVGRSFVRQVGCGS